MQTVKEFLKGTRNNYHVNITQGNNDNVVFDGTYAELKANRKDLLTENVISWDAVPMADGTTDIGIMIYEVNKMDERYIIGQDFNTKDWFIYDNETNHNICWCDSEQEAKDFVAKLCCK